MPTEYRIVDLHAEAIDQNPKIVMAYSPEKAAEIALGVELVRSGSNGNLRARVYFQNDPSQPTSMVRLYHKAASKNGLD